jgi:DNA polymerase-3 subunit epsilon
MLDWLKNINKDYPDFWKTYLSKFENKPDRYVVLSTETSGLSFEKDVILSIGSFAVVDNSILIGDSLEIVVAQQEFFDDKGIENTFTVGNTKEKIEEEDAIEAFIEFIGNSILVGYHIDFDVEMINAALERIECGRLKNEALDIEVMYQKLKDSTHKQFTLNELCTTYKIPQNDRNSSSEDAYKIALLFLKLKSRLGLELNIN